MNSNENKLKSKNKNKNTAIKDMENELTFIKTLWTYA